MKRRLLILLAVALVLGGAAFGSSLAGIGPLAPDKAPAAKPKVTGHVVALPKEFLVNLADGQYARVHVALILRHPPAAADSGHGAAEVPDGYAGIPQEAIVRDTITDALTGTRGRTMLTQIGRRRLKRQIITRLRERTDLDVESLLLTDLAVQ